LHQTANTVVYVEPAFHQEVNERQKARKAKMKTDKKTYVSEHQLHVGDAVLICQHQMKKKDMPYNGKLYYITNIKGNRVTAEVNGNSNINVDQAEMHNKDPDESSEEECDENRKESDENRNEEHELHEREYDQEEEETSNQERPNRIPTIPTKFTDEVQLSHSCRIRKESSVVSRNCHIAYSEIDDRYIDITSYPG